MLITDLTDLNTLNVKEFVRVFEYSDNCMECMLRFTDIASSGFASGVNLPSGQSSNGVMEISLPGLDLGRQPTTWKIVIIEGGDSFTPSEVDMVTPGRKAELVNRLFNYTNIGAFRFPSRIESTAYRFPLASPPRVLFTDTADFQVGQASNTFRVAVDWLAGSKLPSEARGPPPSETSLEQPPRLDS